MFPAICRRPLGAGKKNSQRRPRSLRRMAFEGLESRQMMAVSPVPYVRAFEMSGIGGTGQNMFATQDAGSLTATGRYNYLQGTQELRASVDAVYQLGGVVFLALEDGNLVKLNGGGKGADMAALQEQNGTVTGLSSYNYWLGTQTFPSPVTSMAYADGMTIVSLANGVVLKVAGTGGTGQNMFAITPSGSDYVSLPNWNLLQGTQKFNVRVDRLDYVVGKLFVALDNGTLIKINGTGGTGQNMFAIQSNGSDYVNLPSRQYLAGTQVFAAPVTSLVCANNTTILGLANGLMLKVSGTGDGGQNMFDITPSGNEYVNLPGHNWLLGTEKFDVRVDRLDFVPPPPQLALTDADGKLFVALDNGTLLKINGTGGMGQNMFAIQTNGSDYVTTRSPAYLAGTQLFTAPVTSFLYAYSTTILGLANGLMLKISGTGDGGQNMFDIAPSGSEYVNLPGHNWLQGTQKFNASVTGLNMVNGFLWGVLRNSHDVPAPIYPQSPDWFDMNIQDAALRALGRSYEDRDTYITRNDMLGLFTQAECDGVATTMERNDLHAIIEGAGILGMTESVRRIADVLVANVLPYTHNVSCQVLAQTGVCGLVDNGTLWVFGTDGGDTIDLNQGGGSADSTLSILGAQILVSGQWSSTVTASSVQRIVDYGFGGNDRIKCTNVQSVPTELHGGSGNDILYGGRKHDDLYGEDGDDTLISIDVGAADTLYGQNGTDSFWTDAVADVVADASSYERANNHYHGITAFANDADMTLDGDSIADPGSGHYNDKYRTPVGPLYYKNVGDHPLFAASGPSQLDVFQNNMGDCWALSPLGNAARTNPDAVRQMVVDLGDSTYAVELGGKYYRVDRDLPTWSTASTSLRFAGLGQEGCLWVPIIEKAYALFRPGTDQTGCYGSIDGGWGSEAFNAYGQTGLVSKSFTDSTLALNHIANELAQGKAVVASILQPSTGSPLIDHHCYMVDHVNYTSVNGVQVAVSITLRNPWGIDGAGNDGTNDGLVTITGQQLVGSMFQNGMGIQSAWVV
jgi:hypothetical protein